MNHGFSTLALAFTMSDVRRVELARSMHTGRTSGERVRSAVGHRLVDAGLRLLGTPAERGVRSMSLRGT